MPKYNIANISIDPDDRFEIEALDMYGAINIVLDMWESCDNEVLGVVGFLKGFGIDYGISDDDLDEGSDTVIRSMSKEIRRIIKDNPEREAQFLDAIKHSILITIV